MTSLDTDVVHHAAEDDLPWVDATGGIWLKVLRVDPAAGIWVVRNRFEPGVRLQTHRHTGPVDGYTVRAAGTTSSTSSTARPAPTSGSRPGRSTPSMCPRTTTR